MNKTLTISTPNHENSQNRPCCQLKEQCTYTCVHTVRITPPTPHYEPRKILGRSWRGMKCEAQLVTLNR